jgi:hypothetical protein
MKEEGCLRKRSRCENRGSQDSSHLCDDFAGLKALRTQYTIQTSFGSRTI